MDTALHYREFLELERVSPERVDGIQRDRLESLIRHARSDVPFYRDRASAAQGLQAFPIVTKADIADHFTDFMAPDFLRNFSRNNAMRDRVSWAVVKTGGTTGVPATVIHDGAFRNQGRASRLFSQRLCGFSFGTPYFRLWGSMAEVNAMRDSLAQRVQRVLAKEILLNAFRMDSASMRDYLARMRTSRARHLMAYIDAACALAEFCERSGDSAPALESIMACAGTVTNDSRTLLSKVFGARVHNKYGSRECTDMACECEHGGIHIYSHHVVIEIVDQAGHPVAKGTPGRILVTLLGNHSFPLIRYEIGDVGCFRAGACACGRPWPLLASIEGRTVEFLRGTSGNYVSPVFVRHLVGVVHNPGFIRQYQLVQESDCQFVLSIVSDPASAPDLRERTMREIERDLRTVLGQESILVVRQVTSIPQPENGKLLYTVNRTNPAK